MSMKSPLFRRNPGSEPQPEFFSEIFQIRLKMGNFPQITHLDVQVYFETVPSLESKITMPINLYLQFRYTIRSGVRLCVRLVRPRLRYAYCGLARQFLKKFLSNWAASASRRPFSTAMVWLRRASAGTSGGGLGVTGLRAGGGGRGRGR